MRSSEIEIKGVVVCDDIRQEDNGKLMLIGVYSGDILVSLFPFQRFVCLWFHGRAKKGVYEIETRIRIVSENEESPRTNEKKFKADFSEVDASDIAISVIGVPLVVSGPSEIIIEMRYTEKKWLEFARKKIKLHSSSIAPELPFGQ